MLFYALLLSLFISVSEIQNLSSVYIFLNSDFRQKKVSEIQTVWKRNATELSEIQTSSDFRHSLYIKWSKLVKNVRKPDVQISDKQDDNFLNGLGY